MVLLNHYEEEHLIDLWIVVVGNFWLNKFQEIISLEINEAITKARNIKHLSWTQAAVIVGISRETLKAYEKTLE